MMRGESIRVVHPLFQAEGGGSTPTSPLQLYIGEIEVSKACALNGVWHSKFPVIDESNVIRNRRSVCFGAECNGLFYACAIWSDPIAANRLKNGDKLLELRRMAIADDAPQNTASRMLSVMVKTIKKKWPELVGLISYQDTETHHGTIYKASNWVMAGKPAKFVDWNNKVRKRSVSQSTAPKIRWELHFKNED